MKLITEVSPGFKDEGKKVILIMRCEDCQNKFRALTGSREINALTVEASLPGCFFMQNVATTEAHYKGVCVNWKEMK